MATASEREEKGTVLKLATKPGISLTLAQNLERTDRHPVLIFGSSRAGKSALIMSFIQALQAGPEISVRLGEPVLDRADPRCEEKHRAARDLYERQNYLVDSGVPLMSTQADPFFIPIDVLPKNSLLDPVKFAFLDGRGEDYEPNIDAASSGGNFFKPFSDDVRDLLQTFSYGITILYIAPYSIGSGHERDTRASNFGLLNVIESYREVRKMRGNDFHLFLLSKWDQFADPMNADALFDRPQPSDVDTVLRDRYQQSWGAFQALPLEGPALDRRAFMQYSSGYFVKGNPQTPPRNFAASFTRYPRTLLNWLYGNARRYRLSNETTSITLRKILFDDVVSPDTTRFTMTEWLASVLTSR